MNDSSVISYHGKVLAMSSDRVELALSDTRQSACGTCSQRTGCITADNQSNILQHYTLRIPTDSLGIAIGDIVEMQIPKKAFWMALLFAYLLPTVFAISIMFAMNALLDNVSYCELWIALSGVVAAVAGVLIASLVNRFYRPNIIRRISSV